MCIRDSTTCADVCNLGAVGRRARHMCHLSHERARNTTTRMPQDNLISPRGVRVYLAEGHCSAELLPPPATSEELSLDVCQICQMGFSHCKSTKVRT
eukprot:3170275-Amphidinium_carterae.1